MHCCVSGLVAEFGSLNGPSVTRPWPCCQLFFSHHHHRRSLLLVSMSEEPSHDFQMTMDPDAPPSETLAEEAFSGTEGGDLQEAQDEQPSSQIASTEQAEESPVSTVENSPPQAAGEPLTVDSLAAADQSVVQPPIDDQPQNAGFELPHGAQPPIIVDRTADDSPIPQAGELPFRQSDYFLGPTPAFLLSERSSMTADSLKALGVTTNHPSNEEQPLALAVGDMVGMEDKESLGTDDAKPAGEAPVSKSSRRRTLIVLGVLAAIVVIILAVVLPVYFVVVRKKNNVEASSGHTGGSGGSPTGTGTAAKPTSTGKAGGITGGDGSIVTLANGTTFTYSNPFGGFWVQDPDEPFNNNAQPNSWTPPLNTSWTWGQNRVYGVNLGGWLVLEPFISPSLYQRYPGAVDEYTLSTLMAADTANGGLQQLEDHYNTFITEQDFAEMAGAGLNWIRLPIPFWAIETWPGEPYLAKTAWTYFLKAVEWARKYGLRIYLDLHTVPGSQNGYNHSGRGGKVNFLEGNMGLANAQRTLYYIRVITEFIAQPQYQDVIPIFGIVNEALTSSIGMNEITSFYLEAHDMMRNNITGLGAGHGPYIAIHDGFQPGSLWTGFLQGSDRIIMDTHPYFSFSGEANPQPLDVTGPEGQPGGQWPGQACSAFGPRVDNSRQNFGVTVGGEFSGSPNDCGLFVLGVAGTALTPGCSTYDDWANFSSDMKAGAQNFIEASFDALGDWFFWTWKIGASQVSGNIEAPLWSYQLGYRNGWIPTDPRTAVGKCASLSAPAGSFSAYLPWQTGTPSTIPASSTASFPWPPTTLSDLDVAMTLLPTYTNTAPIITLPPQTFSGAPAAATKSVDGWFNAKDTGDGVTTVAGCTYPDEYLGTFAVIPTAACTGT